VSEPEFPTTGLREVLARMRTRGSGVGACSWPCRGRDGCHARQRPKRRDGTRTTSLDRVRREVPYLIPRWIAFFRPPGQPRPGSVFERELRDSGYADELWAMIRRWETTGYLLPRWRHSEPGTSFDALGRPPRPRGSTTPPMRGRPSCSTSQRTSADGGSSSDRPRNSWSSGSGSGANGSRWGPSLMTRTVWCRSDG